MKLRCLGILILMLALFLPARSFAQVGSTTDILMGKVSGVDSQPVAGARVEATSAETGITRTKTTGADGRYTIVFPDGGGSYRITGRAIGMAPITRDIQRQGDVEPLITDLDMGLNATPLATVDGRASRGRC